MQAKMELHKVKTTLQAKVGAIVGLQKKHLKIGKRHFSCFDEFCIKSVNCSIKMSMYGEAKKLHLIEEILKIENEQLLAEVESVINNGKLRMLKTQDFNVFAGMLSDKEVEEFEKNVEDGCELINTDDWK